VPRQSITEGTVYRRIPDWPSHFDHATRRATYLAFMPRRQDQGAVSLLLKGLVTEDEAGRNPRNPSDRTFGLCELDVAEVREITGEGCHSKQCPASRTSGCMDAMTLR